MFKPKYKITDWLPKNIKRVNSRVVLVDLEQEARALSAHASTSIEGNPLSLDEVRQLLKSRPDYTR